MMFSSSRKPLGSYDWDPAISIPIPQQPLSIHACKIERRDLIIFKNTRADVVNLSAVTLSNEIKLRKLIEEARIDSLGKAQSFLPRPSLNHCSALLIETLC
jgi:hypothetical protein